MTGPDLQADRLGHYDAGEWVRWLDGELPWRQRAAMTRHRIRCAPCADDLRQLRHDGQLVARALGHRTRDPALRHRRLEAAVLVLALGVLAGTVQPVRAWLIDRTRAMWTAVRPDPTPPPPRPAPASPPGSSLTQVAFVPRGSRFVLEIAANQSGGGLVVEGVASDTADATVEGDIVTSRLIVLPTGLRIINRPEATSRYRVRVPETLTVWVVVDTDAPRRIAADSLREGWRLAWEPRD